MITLNTRTRKFSRADRVRIIDMTMRWCKKNLGINRRKWTDVTWKSLRYDDDPLDCGQYLPEENQIEIYWSNLVTVRELVSTCIHEWVHYKQPILTKYHKWKGSYKTNPYEIEATKLEKKYTPVCWQDIQHKVNSKYN